MLVYWQLYSGQLQSVHIPMEAFCSPVIYNTDKFISPSLCVQGLFCVGSLKQYCGQIDGINFAYLLLRLLIYWCLQKEGLFLSSLALVRFLVRKFQQQRGFLISFSKEIIVVKERYICVLLQFTSCSPFYPIYSLLCHYLNLFTYFNWSFFLWSCLKGVWLLRLVLLLFTLSASLAVVFMSTIWKTVYFIWTSFPL